MKDDDYNEEQKIAIRWVQYQHECPYCGEVQDDDKYGGDTWKCVSCDKKYILGEAMQ